MKNIKKFNDFLNEELSPETYKSAAKKLRDKGHVKRAKNIEDYAKSLIKKVKPVTITIDGLDYTLESDNVVVYNETPSSVNINVFGDNRLIDPETAWEVSEIRTSFMIKYGYSDETGTDLENFDDLNNKTIDNFNDYINEIQPFSLNIDYDDNSGIDVSGTVIIDRRTAVKLLRFLKDFGKNHGGNVEKFINELTVNDLYTN